MLFGVFIIGVGLLMLINPRKSRAILRQAGSINLINYTEITVRLVPAVGLVVFSEFSKFPEILNYFGWFMILTSFVLYVIPRKLHHQYALCCADFLQPNYFKLISPFTVLLGTFFIYSTL